MFLNLWVVSEKSTTISHRFQHHTVPHLVPSKLDGPTCMPVREKLFEILQSLGNNPGITLVRLDISIISSESTSGLFCGNPVKLRAAAGHLPGICVPRYKSAV